MAGSWGLSEADRCMTPDRADAAPRAYTRPTWLKEVVAASKPFHVRAQVRWQHNLLNLTCAAAVYAAIAGLVAVAPWVPALPYFLVTVPALGLLYLGVFVLVVHEASHDMFLVVGDAARTRALNRVAGWVGCLPFFTNYDIHWAREHQPHHLRPGTEVDRHLSQVLTGAPFRRRLLRLLLIPGWVLRVNPSSQYGFDPVRLVGGFLTFVIPVVAVSLLVDWKAGVALVAGVQALGVFNLIKNSFEHNGGILDHPDPLLRSRTWFVPFSNVLAPFHINYHFEHHAAFMVPWYRLPAYHRAIRDRFPPEVRPFLIVDRHLALAAGTVGGPPA